MARYDLRLSWEEFADLTPSMFAALCKRRNVRLKHERYANAETAAAVYNTNRAGPDSPMVSAYDFVRDGEAAKEHAERAAIKRQINSVVGGMPSNTPRERLMKVRATFIEQLTGQGRTDAAELWAECWPDLIPEGTE